MSLQDMAENARLDKAQEARERNLENREKTLTAVIEKRYADRYGGFGRLAEEGVEVPSPSRDDFAFVKDVREFKGHRSGTISGWQIVVDDVPFLFSTTHGSEGLYLIHLCPKCGIEGASTFHGLDDVGKLLKFGPQSWSHTCWEAETREVAYALATAARDLKSSVETVYEEALTRQSDLIARLLFNR